MKYCKKCGKQLEDGALFCSECGAKVEEKEEQQKNEPAHKGLGCCVVLLVVFFAVILIFAICREYISDHIPSDSSEKTEESGGTKKIFSRDANNGDIEIMSTLNMSALGVDLVITPNTDIKQLKIQIIDYDEAGNILHTQTVTLGNVKEGVQIKKTISMTDYDMGTFFKIEKTQIRVVGGTVSFLK